jgi:hypothetical protein
MNRRLLGSMSLGLALAAAALAAPPAAVAAGGALVGGDAGPGGLVTPDGEARYLALPTATGTAVIRVNTDGGRVRRSASLGRRFMIPSVALDGTASGLSADGETLVLASAQLGLRRESTTFAILGAKQLRLRELVTLRGAFSFDALSPDGRTLYLVEYLSPRDPTRYRVRAYDAEQGRLLPESIVDPSEAPDEMRGFPVTRATSPDGRWAYTLYDGAGEHPFIHALDTVEGEAVCIDLDALADRGRQSLYRLGFELSADGGTLSVLDPGRPVADSAPGPGTPVAFVDTATFEVSEPRAPDAAAEEEGGGLPWPIIAVAGVAVLLVALALAGALPTRVRGR